MEIYYSGICDRGLKRTRNQDAIFMFSSQKKSMSLFVIADGMGGHAEGERASRAIVKGLEQWTEKFQAEHFEEQFSKMMISLQNKIEEISRLIYLNYNQDQVCGSTCVLLFIYKETYGVISIGDSRIYQKRGWGIHSIMVDDVWENQRSVRDFFSAKDMISHPNYGKLVQAVGTKEKISLSVKTDLLKTGDSFLLCSDGLYKYCPVKVYKKIIKGLSTDNLEESARVLIAKTYEAGAWDNISVILVKCI